MVATQFGEMVMLLGFSPHVNPIRNMRVVGSEECHGGSEDATGLSRGASRLRLRDKDNSVYLDTMRLARGVSQLLRSDRNVSVHSASPCRSSYGALNP